MAGVSTIAFSLGAAFVLSRYDFGGTQLYSDPCQYGWWYLGISFVTVLVLQDTYFYFVHRMFHHPFIFKWMHSGHHRSGDPTPWTSFAFDLPEAIVQMIFFVGIVLLIPLHFATVIAVLLTMTVWAVWNHLGFELFPPSFAHHWLSRWFIGSTHHSIHHRSYTVHYGLYFTLWDRLLGTQDPRYEHEFAAVLKRSSPVKHEIDKPKQRTDPSLS
nr:sterol desaturase family protein [Oculatella sp. LEGE 06141]